MQKRRTNLGWAHTTSQRQRRHEVFPALSCWVFLATALHGPQLQILWPVVGPVAILVVHALAGEKCATDFLFNNVAMFEYPRAIDLDENITLNVCGLRSVWKRFTITSFLAREHAAPTRTEATRFPMRSLKLLATAFTFDTSVGALELLGAFDATRFLDLDLALEVLTADRAWNSATRLGEGVPALC